MGSKSIRKGYEYERELVVQAQESGLRAKRAWGSNGTALGLHTEVDMTLEEYTVQAKRRKELPSYIKPSKHVDFQVIREDHGKSYAVVDWFFLLDLIKAAQGCRDDEGGEG